MNKVCVRATAVIDGLAELPSEESGISRDDPTNLVAVGQWFWVSFEKDDRSEDGDQSNEWFACITHIGSNYVELRAREGRGQRYTRILFKDFWDRVRHEPNAEGVIHGKIREGQSEVAHLMAEVQELTMRLGLRQSALPGATGHGSGTALATLSSQTDPHAYKNALIKAQKETLPELFEKIRKAQEGLSGWLTAQTLPIEAAVTSMKSSVDGIQDRIFTLGLYAGLTETVVPCCDGEPAAITEKLHVMQRCLYMDEESLLSYRAGGLDFNGIEDFDAWISLPENRDRLLPFPRTVVAMRVRRVTKEREWTSLRSLFVNFQMEEADKTTFLYIRNGDRVSRLNCDMDFGAMIFPDRSEYDPAEPVMVRKNRGSLDETLSVREYEESCKEYDRVQKELNAWKARNPGKRIWDSGLPVSSINEVMVNGRSFSPREWALLDENNEYLDDHMAVINEKVKEYNRVATIIQGLFDRSEALHPHPPVKTWTPQGFAAAITLVYDAKNVLYDGLEAPDFEAYRAKCNALFESGSIAVGQETFWLHKEAEKENERSARGYRGRGEPLNYTTFRPYGNPGPGYLAVVETWHPRAKTAKFLWNRQRLSSAGWYDPDKRMGAPIETSLTVPASELFNVSAYQPGDFKQFFKDPRTREKYLKWAPLLLAAEDYHAGLLAVGASSDGTLRLRAKE